MFASRLPSDPGVKLFLAEATLEEKRVPRRSIFGRQVVSRTTGAALSEPQSLVRGESVFLEVEDVPVFYLPFVQGDARDPFGPVEAVNVGWNRIFGVQVGTALDVYDLIGVEPLAGTRWRWDLDYLSKRGPGMGTDFNYAFDNLFGIAGRHTGFLKAWGLYDDGPDNLGGGRPPDPFDHPYWRGRATWQHLGLDLPYGFGFQAQASGLSDKNFLEQYYKQEFDLDVNKETTAYLIQQGGSWAWTLLGEVNTRRWVNETEWFPRAEGYLIGYPLFNLFSYTTRANVGYGQLHTTRQPPPPISPTDVPTSAARLDSWHELSLPFYLGPFKVAPYLVGDVTYYSEDLTGDDQVRLLGGGGLRASIPFTRLYPGAQSDLFNLNGINHKVVLSGNYYIVDSNTAFTRLPQFDRLDDDATDQARRDITPIQPQINPANGVFLQNDPLFNLQTYAIRRLVTNRIDTLDSINVLQLDLRQRWQTKRGYPGQQHVVDWMTLDLSGSAFPDADRDNFGSTFAFLEYDWVWNVGDRTALTSTGWVDPIDHGARVFTVGGYFNRPDRTSLFLGYRTIDPVDSRALTGAFSYIFSPKYAMTASSTYDFGTNQALSNSLVLTRMGKDLQLSLGFTYNVLQNNFGVTFNILPNLVTYGPRPVNSPALGINR